MKRRVRNYHLHPLNLNNIEKCLYIYNTSEKDSFINFLNTSVAELRKNLNKESATKIKFLLSIKKDLETTNVNLKLASDFICTNL